MHPIQHRLIALEDLVMIPHELVSRCKDTGTHRAVLGFADKQMAEQVGKTVKDLSSHEGDRIQRRSPARRG